jgi:hypothetical protein
MRYLFFLIILLFASETHSISNIVISKEYIDMNINNSATGFSIIGHIENRDTDIAIVIKSNNKKYDVKFKEKSLIGYRSKHLKDIDFPKYINIATTKLDLLEKKDILDNLGLKNLHEIDEKIINYLVDTKQIEVYHGDLLYKNSDIFRYKFNFSERIPIGSYDIDVYYIIGDQVEHAFHDNIEIKKNKYLLYIENIKKENKYMYAIYIISFAFIASGVVQLFVRILNNILKCK